VTQNGNTWITSRNVPDKGKTLVIRTTFVFVTPDKQTTTVQLSAGYGKNVDHDHSDYRCEVGLSHAPGVCYSATGAIRGVVGKLHDTLPIVDDLRQPAQASLRRSRRIMIVEKRGYLIKDAESE
jgi:hypothetical protein